MAEERTIDFAFDQYQRGNLNGAIDSLKRVLADDPDHASAHALLSFCLLDMRRAHAAEHEAGMALALEPENEMAHHAMALSLLARRRFKDAEAHAAQMLDFSPEEPAYYRLLASILEVQGTRKGKAHAHALLEKALELAPDDANTLAALGSYHLQRGKLEQALHFARETLQTIPEHIDGLVLMGGIALRTGDTTTARDHALWALRSNATHRGALHLMAGIKARENPLLGWWWRFATWMGELGSGRAITVLLCAFLVYRLSALILTDLGHPDAANMLQLVWLALCIYTWVGPGLFQKAVKRELETVKLRDF